MDQQPGLGNFVQNLNSSQYQQLMTMLSTHLASNSNSTSSDQDENTSTYAAGICHSKLISPTFTSKNIWIMDSGASKHVSSTADAFVNLRTIDNSSVTLPDQSRIPVNMCGDIRLSIKLMIHDVLFVPHFKFNLISVSGLTALTAESQLTMSFFPNQFTIQDASNKRMIGSGKNGDCQGDACTCCLP